MLATQDRIYSFQETHFFTDTIHLIEVNRNGHVKAACLRAVFKSICEHTEYEFPENLQHEIVDLANKGALSSKMIFEYLVTELLAKQLSGQELNSIRWIEKTPGHIKHLELIKAMYPNGSFIEIVRNPINAIASYKKKLPDGIKHTGTGLAHQWKQSKNLFSQFSDLRPENSYSVKYEDIVRNPQSELRKITNFLQVTMDIEKLRDIQAVASGFVLEKETWKHKNLTENISPKDHAYKLPYVDMLTINFILRDEIRDLGYYAKHRWVQYIYNVSMLAISRIGKIQQLSLLKRFAKKTIGRTRLWPYIDK
jgi:hypothetical protein